MTTANRFGGFWTADKLQVLHEYLNFFCNALKRQPFSLVYIDAFAGTGRCHIKGASDDGHIIDGSAAIALNCEPPFHAYRFIEKKRAHQAELDQLVAQHPNGARARIARGSAQDLLPPMLTGYDWKRWRGVLFLDPFGLQITWPVLQQIADTKALDVFFLVSLSGLYRQAARQERGIDEGKANKLTNFLGTSDWRDAIYVREQGDLFDGPQRSRDAGWEAILNFTTQRLKFLFPYVGEPNLMQMQNGAPLFALYFAVSNPAPEAVGLASRVSRDILSRLPR